MAETTLPLPARGMRLVENLLKRECNRLTARIGEEYNVDVRCGLRSDLSHAERTLAAVQAWSVKP